MVAEDWWRVTSGGGLVVEWTGGGRGLVAEDWWRWLVVETTGDGVESWGKELVIKATTGRVDRQRRRLAAKTSTPTDYGANNGERGSTNL